MRSPADPSSGVPAPDAGPRRAYLAVAALLVPIGFALKALPGWGADHGAGALYVAFWVFAALSLRPSWRPAPVAALVLALTCVLELAQTLHPPWLEAFRATRLGSALVGSTFDPRDLPPYGLGALGAFLGARALRARRAAHAARHA